jgi:osomolarity two-component system response regulator SSK1
MQALIDFEGWRKWRGYEDSPRSIGAILEKTTSAHSPSRPRNNTIIHAIKISTNDSGKKDGAQISIIEPDTSGSSSSKDEDIEVPVLQELAQELAQEPQAAESSTNGV